MKYDLILSLGSNIEPKLDYLKKAILLLKEKFEFVNVSSVYKTAPVDDLDQDLFYNICVIFKTSITDPFTVLAIVKAIEEDIGRQKDKNRPKGPRTIDIDIILFHDKKVISESLTIPHKSMPDRNFVLIPLHELLIKEYEHLIIKYDIKQSIKYNSEQQVQKVGVLKLNE